MRKIFLLLTILLLGFGLAACGDEAVGFPEFDEDNVVELSATEMVTLFESIDYTSVDSESVRISVVGNLHTIDEEVDGTYSYYNEVKLDIDSVLYALVSEQVAESKLFAEATV